MSSGLEAALEGELVVVAASEDVWHIEVVEDDEAVGRPSLTKTGTATRRGLEFRERDGEM